MFAIFKLSCFCDSNSEDARQIVVEFTPLIANKLFPWLGLGPENYEPVDCNTWAC